MLNLVRFSVFPIQTSQLETVTYKAPQTSKHIFRKILVFITHFSGLNFAWEGMENV